MEFFSLIAEESFNTDDSTGAIVTGFGMGRVSIGDKLYYYHPSKKVITAEVKSILVGADEYQGSANNQPVALEFTGLRKGDISKFTVLSNLEKVLVPTAQQTYNNPEILGLLYGFNKFSKDTRFLTTLVYYLTHGKFLVEVETDAEPAIRGEQAVLPKGMKMGIPAIKNTDGKTAIPIFTDQATSNLGQKLTNTDIRKMMLIDMDRAAKASANQYDGVVLNPYGPVPFFMDNSYLKQLGVMPKKK